MALQGKFIVNFRPCQYWSLVESHCAIKTIDLKTGYNKFLNQDEPLPCFGGLEFVKYPTKFFLINSKLCVG